MFDIARASSFCCSYCLLPHVHTYQNEGMQAHAPATPAVAALFAGNTDHMSELLGVAKTESESKVSDNRVMNEMLCSVGRE